MLLYKMSFNLPIAQQLPQMQEGLSNSIGNVATSLGDVRGSINSSVQDFASKDLVGSSNEFLQANTMVAKFVFIVLVLIIFLILMNLGIYLLSYFFQPTKSPYLVKGIMAGNEAKQIKQNPASPDAITIYRSNNQTTGMEYTWSVWLSIDDVPAISKTYDSVSINTYGIVTWPGHGLSKGAAVTFSKKFGSIDANSTCYVKEIPSNGTFTISAAPTGGAIGGAISAEDSAIGTALQFNHVFSKGVTKPASTDIAPSYGNNAPGVYLIGTKDRAGITDTSNNVCTMKIVMDTVGSNDQQYIDIPEIPLKKWIHVAIRLENKILDVYINGTLKQRLAFQNVPKQNYGDVWVCQNSGFIGKLSDLRYFDSALNVFQLTNITLAGPNMKSSLGPADTSSDYLSNRWF